MIYIVGKVLAYIFLPPGVFILLFIVLLVLSYRTKRTTTRVILALMVLFVYTLSIEPVSRLLLTPLERVYPFRTADSFTREEAEAIVVLGAGTTSTPDYYRPTEGGSDGDSGPTEKDSGPTEGGSDGDSGPGSLSVPRASDETLARVVHGFLIYRSTGLPIVVSGGSARGNRAGGDSRSGEEGGAETETTDSKVVETKNADSSSEAEVMKTALLELGVPADRILTETESRTTAENALNLASMEQFSRIILVTSAYHLPRSVWLFEQSGIQSIPAPTDYKNGDRDLSVWSFFPTMQVLSSSYRALHEYAGIVFNLLQFINNEKKG